MDTDIMVKVTTSNSVDTSKVRDSNLELFRIFAMLLIVAHHYVVHSGLMPLVEADFPSMRSIYLSLIGCAGKIGINCFVLITGFFMCTSQITLQKGLKLLLQIEFYKIISFVIFFSAGYFSLTPKNLFNNLSPIVGLENDFVSCYLVFFCFIPFLNILLRGVNQRQHQILLALCMIVFCVLPQVLIPVNCSYVAWFMAVYFVAAYFRFYPPKWSASLPHTMIVAVFCVILSLVSVVIGACISVSFGKGPALFFFVADANKPLAITTALSLFLFFKNLKLNYSKTINTIAATTFGVLLIHDSCPAMRQWLWKDCLDCVGYYSNNIWLHVIVCVFVVYIGCSIVDYIRIQLLEKPVFKAIVPKFTRHS